MTNSLAPRFKKVKPFFADFGAFLLRVFFYIFAACAAQVLEYWTLTIPNSARKGNLIFTILFSG